MSRVEVAGDPRLAPFRDVGVPAALTAAGLFVAEGRLVVQRLLDDGRFEPVAVLVTPAAFSALETRLHSASCDVLVCSQTILDGVTGFNFHRGCLALARRPPGDGDPDELTAMRCVAALEGVGNPDNIGGIFRTALALGAEGVLLDPSAGDPLYRKAIRTSMAATLRVPFARATAWHPTLERFRGRGFRLIALTPDAGAISIDDLSSHPRNLLLLGAEGPGLAPGTMAMADVRVRIPIDPRADSVNVAVAAGIALHALRRRGA